MSAHEVPRMKPYVLCHMVMSVDGRIWGSRWRPKANVIPNLFEKLHDQLVAQHGGGSWLCGRVTAQEFARGKDKKEYPPSDQTAPEPAVQPPLPSDAVSHVSYSVQVEVSTTSRCASEPASIAGLAGTG